MTAVKQIPSNHISIEAPRASRADVKNRNGHGLENNDFLIQYLYQHIGNGSHGATLHF